MVGIGVNTDTQNAPGYDIIEIAQCTFKVITGEAVISEISGRISCFFFYLVICPPNL